MRQFQRHGTYTIAPVNGAASYTWLAPAGATVSSGQGTTSITVAFSSSFTSGVLSVKAENSCGLSAARTAAVRSVLDAPGTISGAATGVCANTAATYSVTPVVGAVSYTWTSPAGAVIASGQGTTSVIVNFGSTFTTGSLTVTAHNACGPGPARSLTVRSSPSTPGVITGPATVCKSQTNVTYSIAAVTGATSYIWTVPTGATLVSGQGTTSISLTYGAGTGTLSLSVKASNGCGLSAARTMAVTVNSCVREMASTEVELTAFEVYPNPGNGQFRINYSIEKNGTVQLQLFDVTGRVAKQQTLQVVKGNNSIEVEAGTLPKGVYLLKLTAGVQIQHQRIVLE
jgi:large repetitive protein